MSTTSFTTTQLKLKSGTLPCHVAGQGRPVLCLHSAGGVRLSPALERLSESFRLYVPVMPGFDGTAPGDGAPSMAGLADLAAEVVDAAIGGPCDVIGHSFGGWVATWLAVRHAAKVQQLVLHASAGFRRGAAGGLAGDPETLRRAMYAHPENLPPESKSAEVQAQNRAAAARYNGGVPIDQELAGRLKDVNALTLILHGTRDRVIPPDSPRLLKAGIPRAYLVYVYDAAHAIDVDQPVPFVRLVRDFFERGEAFIVNRGSAAAQETQ
jgi:pimeloyl-ACP methyl ester carboxylesterase